MLVEERLILVLWRVIIRLRRIRRSRIRQCRCRLLRGVRRIWNVRLRPCWVLPPLRPRLVRKIDHKCHQYLRNQIKLPHPSRLRRRLAIPHLQALRSCPPKDVLLRCEESRRSSMLDIPMEGWCRLNCRLCTLMYLGESSAAGLDLDFSCTSVLLHLRRAISVFIVSRSVYTR